MQVPHSADQQLMISRAVSMLLTSQGVSYTTMKNYLCKWPNGDVVLVSARDRQEVRLVSAHPLPHVPV
jgi:hypothetical protein